MRKIIAILALGMMAMPSWGQTPNFNDWGKRITIGENPQFGIVWVKYNQDNTRESGSTKGAGGHPYFESGNWTLDKKNGKSCRKITWRNGNTSCH